ncbi:MAG: type IIL restriction-modification enzyme MmeI [Deinococcales bacterium]
MPLSWNEIKNRAYAFIQEWKDEKSEDAEAKSFWDGFLDIFGVSRRRVASFEKQVSKFSGKSGFIDLFWPGTLLVEHKSRGKDLEKAHDQAHEYLAGLSDDELPQYLLVSDFAQFRLYDLDKHGDLVADFALSDLSQNLHHFAFIAGYQSTKIQAEDPVNIEAVEKMGKLYDQLKAIGYEGHVLELYTWCACFFAFLLRIRAFSKRACLGN